LPWKNRRASHRDERTVKTESGEARAANREASEIRELVSRESAYPRGIKRSSLFRSRSEATKTYHFHHNFHTIRVPIPTIAMQSRIGGIRSLIANDLEARRMRHRTGRSRVTEIAVSIVHRVNPLSLKIERRTLRFETPRPFSSVFLYNDVT